MRIVRSAPRNHYPPSPQLLIPKVLLSLSLRLRPTLVRPAQLHIRIACTSVRAIPLCFPRLAQDMSALNTSRWQRLRTGRVRILWLVLGAMLLVGAVPILLYHRQVLQLSQDKLINTELVQQADLTRSLAREIELFQSNLTQQLVSERQIMNLMGLSDDVESAVNEPKVYTAAGKFHRQQSRHIHVFDCGRKERKGTVASQGNFRADQDPFCRRALQRAFQASAQSLPFRSDPLALAPDNRPAFVIAVPLKDWTITSRECWRQSFRSSRFCGFCKTTACADRAVFVIDHAGHIVAHPDTKNLFLAQTPAGGDSSRIVEQSWLCRRISAPPATIRYTEVTHESQASR